MDIVRRYLDEFFSPNPDTKVLRNLLSADFSFKGPLMSCDSADNYIQQLDAMGIAGLRAENTTLAQSDDKQIVAALYDLITPTASITTSEWFWIRDDRINRIRLTNDPRPILSAFGSR